jgi:glutamyl endopeptidase
MVILHEFGESAEGAEAAMTTVEDYLLDATAPLDPAPAGTAAASRCAGGCGGAAAAGRRPLAAARETADYQIIEADTRQPVLRTDLAPFRYICNLEYQHPRFGRQGMCTGTLVGPRTVLTAGHCLTGREPARMRVYPGRRGSTAPYGSATAVRFVTPPGFRMASPTDYALVHLDRPIGDRIGYWSGKRRTWPWDPVGTSMPDWPLAEIGRLRVNVSGYPADKPAGDRYHCSGRSDPQQEARCWHTFLGDPRRSALCGTEQWRAYDQVVEVAGGMLHHRGDTCPGHSGSPVWVRDPRHGRVLVAIHVAGDDGVGTVANRAVVLTPDIRAFIDRNLV